MTFSGKPTIRIARNAALLFCVGLVAAIAIAKAEPAAPKAAQDIVTTPTGRAKFVQNYCVACHNARAKTGGLVLEGIAADAPLVHADIWEKVVKRLGAGE